MSPLSPSAFLAPTFPSTCPCFPSPCPCLCSYPYTCCCEQSALTNTSLCCLYSATCSPCASCSTVFPVSPQTLDPAPSSVPPQLATSTPKPKNLSWADLTEHDYDVKWLYGEETAYLALLAPPAPTANETRSTRLATPCTGCSLFIVRPPAEQRPCTVCVRSLVLWTARRNVCLQVHWLWTLLGPPPLSSGCSSVVPYTS